MANQSKKAIIITAPSGAGKTTIIKKVLQDLGNQLEFSVSATTRKPRPGEVDGVDYYFLDQSLFDSKQTAGDFIEWEEVYPGLCYGTPKTELDRIWNKDKNVLFEIDVKGAVNVKQQLKHQVLAIFIRPPSIEVLQERLSKRGTEDAVTMETRLARVNEELSYQKHFDAVIINDELLVAVEEVKKQILDFIK